MKKIEVSICITTYNMAHFVDRAIESVLRQKTRFEFEIIISDDHSTDTTKSILNKYKNISKVRIIESEENLGVMKSTAEAIHASNGDFIALLDGDDYWLDNYKLQKQYDLLKNNIDLGYVFTNYLKVDEDENKEVGFNSHFSFPTTNQYEYLILNYPILTSTTFFRKSLLEFGELDNYVKKQFPTSDLALFIGFSLKSNGYYFSDVTTYYNYRSNSQSRQQNIEKLINHFIKRNQIVEYFLQQTPIDTQKDRQRKFDFQLKILLASWQTNDFQYIKSFSEQMRIIDFLFLNLKATYIYVASKNKRLYKLFKPWVLRHRKFSK